VNGAFEPGIPPNIHKCPAASIQERPLACAPGILLEAAKPDVA
jgi:hypothetical protein